MMQKMLKEQKEHPETLCISIDPVDKRVPVQSEAPREEKSADKEKAHGEQSRAAPEETVPEEIASMKAPPDMKTGQSMLICLSRVVPVDHEARSQVKVKEKSSCRSEGTQSTQKKDCMQQNSRAWGRPRAMQGRSVRTRRASAADCSANDTAKQATMTRETDISAEHVEEK